MYDNVRSRGLPAVTSAVPPPQADGWGDPAVSRLLDHCPRLPCVCRLASPPDRLWPVAQRHIDARS